VTRRRRLLVAAAVLGLGSCLPVAVWIRLPLPAGMIAPPAEPGLVLLDRHGVPLRQARAGDGSRSGWTPLAELDPQLMLAFIAREDRRFQTHRGVDLRAVTRATLQSVRGGRVVSGASTITMQLARLLRPGRGVRGKASQVLWALRLERSLDKQQILEQYLNRVPLGEGTVGVAAAAELYFGAGAGRLSLGQAAMLAGLASAPSAGNPVRSPERARALRARALERMVALGYASEAEADQARHEPVAAPGGGAPFLAPHFTSRLLARIADSTARGAGRMVTSLDLELQAAIEAEVRNTVVLLREREVRHAAAVVLDNRTGEVLAWAGSPDFQADSTGQVDMVVSPRQPGSTLKPFLYAMALDRGYTGASVLPDVPRAYMTATGPYQPRNYDRLFHGPVRVREALASSFNVPAVELTDRIGAGALLGTLHGAGFSSLTSGADHYGLGLSLGNGDVSLLELANGYRALVGGGVWRPVRWTVAAQGHIQAVPDGIRPFVSAGAAALVLDMLTDADARIAGFGADTPFDFPFPVAVKTGTSHHFTDNWAVGATGRFTVAVWVGNFSGRPMRRVSGVTGAGPLLQRAVLAVARRHDPGVLPSPAAAGAARARICRLSGRRAGAICPQVDEWFLPGTAPLPSCDWHGAMGRVSWPAEYASWVATHPREAAQLAGTSSLAGPVVTSGDPGLRIDSPRDGDRYEIPPGSDPRYSTVALRAVGTAAEEPLTWYVDGQRVNGSRWVLRPGAHLIRAEAASGHSAQVRISVR
jgi:penicillin-binding protein 1C